MNGVVEEAEDGSGEPAKQAVGAGRDRVEHRLHVRRRTGDHLQDVGRCGLPLQRLLRLVEQARILDGDHGLVGEGLEQGELLVRKPESGLRVAKDDRADALFPIDKRHVGDGSKATRGSGFARKLGRTRGRDIGNLDDTTFENCPCGRHAVPIERNWINRANAIDIEARD